MTVKENGMKDWVEKVTMIKAGHRSAEKTRRTTESENNRNHDRKRLVGRKRDERLGLNREKVISKRERRSEEKTIKEQQNPKRTETMTEIDWTGRKRDEN